MSPSSRISRFVLSALLVLSFSILPLAYSQEEEPAKKPFDSVGLTKLVEDGLKNWDSWVALPEYFIENLIQPASATNDFKFADIFIKSGIKIPFVVGSQELREGPTHAILRVFPFKDRLAVTGALFDKTSSEEALASFVKLEDGTLIVGDDSIFEFKVDPTTFVVTYFYATIFLDGKVVGRREWRRPYKI